MNGQIYLKKLEKSHANTEMNILLYLGHFTPILKNRKYLIKWIYWETDQQGQLASAQDAGKCGNINRQNVPPYNSLPQLPIKIDNGINNKKNYSVAQLIQGMQNQMVSHINRPTALADKCIILPKTPLDGSYPKLAKDHWAAFDKDNMFQLYNTV